MAVALGCAIQASLNQGSVFQEYDTDCDVFRQRFRQFQYKEASGPHEAFNKLWELCCQWLKPKMRSKEQILELLVLEQLLSILPPEIERRVSPFGIHNREVMLGFIEVLQGELKTPEQQIDSQEMFLEELAPVGMEPVTPNMHLEPAPLPVMGAAPEAAMAEVWMPPAGPQELNYAAAGECQPFPDPGFQSEWHVSSTGVWPATETSSGPPQWLALSLPDPESRFPVNDRKEPLSKEELHTPKNAKLQFLDSNIDRNMLLHPNFLENCEHLGNSLGHSTEQPSSDMMVPDPHKRPSLGEIAECSNLQVPRGPIAHKQSCPSEKSYSCMRCGKRFATLKLLKGHMKIHSGELPHKCTICEKKFLRKSDLKRHNRVHTRETPYECNVCKKRFSQKTHLMTHSEHELYQCFECRITFCNKLTFQGHMKSHTGGKPHTCLLCGKRFRRKTNLTLHLQTHTSARPYVCECCGKSYRQKSSLVSHLKLHKSAKPDI